MSRVIVVTSGKGGVGKTSITANLAISLAKSKHRVCIIDADFGLKNMDLVLGLENRVIYDIKDVIDGKCSLEKVIVRDKRCETLYLLPSCKSLHFADIDIGHMQNIVAKLKIDFDFILIDCPAGVEKGFQYAIGVATEAIVVVNLDISSIRDADRVIGLLLKEGITNIKLITNKVNMEYIEDNKTLDIDDATNVLSIPLLGIVYDDSSMIEGNNKGCPALFLPKNILHECFDNIARRIMGESVPFLKLKKKGIFAKLLSK